LPQILKVTQYNQRLVNPALSFQRRRTIWPLLWGKAFSRTQSAAQAGRGGKATDVAAAAGTVLQGARGRPYLCPAAQTGTEGSGPFVPSALIKGCLLSDCSQ